MLIHKIVRLGKICQKKFDCMTGIAKVWPTWGVKLCSFDVQWNAQLSETHNSVKRTTQWNPQLSETHIQVTKRTGQIHAQLIQWNAQVSERHNSLNHTIHWKAVQWRGIVWSKDVDKIHLTVRWEVVRISGLLSPRALDRVAVDVGVVDADDGVGRRFFCGKSGSGNNFLLPAIVCKLFQ